MTSKFDLILHGGTVATTNGLEQTCVGVRDGKIAGFGDLDPGQAAESVDASGLHVLPGVIDSQVHFREPGLEHKEDLYHGMKAAVLGGVTAIFEMPNTSPSTIRAEDFQSKLDRAAKSGWCDHAFFIGAAEENADRLGELEQLPGCSGVKIFMGSSTGSLLVKDDDVLLEVLKNGRRRCSVHSEDEDRLVERQQIAVDGGHPRVHPEWRDVEVAVRSTNRLLGLARKAGRRVHVLHITTGDEMAILKDHKDIATVECTLNHLTLAAPDCYERLGAYAQMNPPVRDQAHQDALWQAIRDGVVDVIGSDHAPHTHEEKQRPYPQSPSGMPGVQTLLPLLLNHMNQGRLSLERLIDLTSASQQRVFGIAGKGRIALGYDADFSIVDLKAEREITNDWIASKCGWTPFDGMKVTGWPIATIIRGNLVMKDNDVLGEPIGQPVRFTETMAGV